MVNETLKYIRMSDLPEAQIGNVMLASLQDISKQEAIVLCLL